MAKFLRRAAFAIWTFSSLALCLPKNAFVEPCYTTASQLLAPFQSCQIKLIILSSNNFPLLGHDMVKVLADSWVPHESFYGLPAVRVHHYARRHRNHCSVRIALPSSSYNIELWSASSLKSSYPWRFNREREIVVFLVEAKSPADQIAFKPSPWGCFQPLNILVFLYTQGEQGLNLSKLVVVPRPCNNGHLLCHHVDYNSRLQQTIMPESYQQIVNKLRKLRTDFQGRNVLYFGVSTPYGWKWEEIQILAASDRFRYPHKAPEYAEMQVPLILRERFNFTFRVTVPERFGFNGFFPYTCKHGAFGKGISYDQKDDQEGTGLNLWLDRFVHLRAFYTTTDDAELSPSPYKLMSMVLPADALVWALLLMAVIIVWTTTIAVNWSAKDYLGLGFATACPLAGQTFPCGGNESKFKFWFSFWIFLAFVLSTEYTNYMKSLTTLPQRQRGVLSVGELLARNFTMGYISQAEYQDVEASMSYSGTRWEFGTSLHEMETKILSRLKVPQEDSGWVTMEYTQEFYSQPRVMGVGREDSVKLNLPIIARLAGRSIHESPDELFRRPQWWFFNHMPSSDVVGETFRSIQNAGLYTYWQRAVDKATERIIQEQQEQSLEILQKEDGLEFKTELGGTLADTMIRESLCLLLYGLFTAFMIWLVEYIFGGTNPCIAIEFSE